MQDLEKVSGSRLIAFWKNQSMGLLVVLVSLLLSQLLPYYFSPIVALIGAAVLYTILYNDKFSTNPSCMIGVYALFYCMVSYSFMSIVVNILYIWNMIELPKELVFFHAPYIPSLILDPVCMVTMLIIYMRKNSLKYCVKCKFTNGTSIERGRFGDILHSESKVQIKNLFIIFTILTIILWAYYYTLYDRGSVINNRDSYIFFWLNVVVIALDEVYFGIRYYNIYLDLKDSGDIISESELSDMTTKTYLRFYVICGNYMYVNPKTIDPSMPFRQIIDTPFVTKRNVNGITTAEVDGIIRQMTQENGHLRFFYGRRNPDLKKHSLLRYFYFFDGTPEDYPEMNVAGEWMDFNRIKHIYNQSPTLMARTFLADISRMTTIVLTQKIFDDRGYRKVKVKSYQPSYDLTEVRDNDYDFQDDKWVRIAMFNSDTKGFHVRRLWQKMVKQNTGSQQWRQ